MSAPWMVFVEFDETWSSTQIHVQLGEVLPAAGAALVDAAQRRGLCTAVLTSTVPGPDVLDHLGDRWLLCDTGAIADVGAAVAALPGPVRAIVSPEPGHASVSATVARALGLPGATPGTRAFGASSTMARPRGLAARGGVVGAPARHGIPSSPSASGVGIQVEGQRRPWSGLTSTRRGAWSHPGQQSGAQCTGGPRFPASRAMGATSTVVHSVEGFVEPTGLVHIHAWMDSQTARSVRRRTEVTTVTSEPPDSAAREAVAAVLARAGYDFGPFCMDFLVTAAGLRVLRWAPSVSGAGVRQCVEAVSGHDPADYLLARLLGLSPRPPRPAVGAAAWLRRSVLTAEGRVVAPDPRRISDVPGFIAADVRGTGGNVIVSRVLALGTSAAQARRRCFATAQLLGEDANESEPV